MRTKIEKIDRNLLKKDKGIYKEVFKGAARIINEGGLVSFPTETVYGLGANALDSLASKKIYEAKGRPSDNPLIIHIHEKDLIKNYAKNIPDLAYKLIDKFWPGPLTLILLKKDCVPLETTGGLLSVGIRMPKDEIALEFIKECNLAIAAPSANLSTRPSPTKAKHVYEDLKDRIDFIIDGGSTQKGIESTIVDLTKDVPVVLRPGSITLSMLREVDENICLDKSLLKKEEDASFKDIVPLAPGMKYKHYAPRAELYILREKEASLEEFIRAISLKESKKIAFILSSKNYSKVKELSLSKNIYIKDLGDKENPEEIAKNLFASFRDFDEQRVGLIYSEDFSGDGILFSIMNRLLKAAGYKILEI